MRRTTFDKLLGWVGISLGIVLLAVGGLLLWGSAYVHNTVQGQLAAQQITFPPAAAFAHAKAGTEITPNMIPSVSQYAGQQLLTGQQAEAYADHFIAHAHHRHGRRQDLLPAVGRVAGAAEQHPADRPGRHRVQGRDAAVHAAERLRLVEGLPDHLHHLAGRRSGSAP